MPSNKENEKELNITQRILNLRKEIAALDELGDDISAEQYQTYIKQTGILAKLIKFKEKLYKQGLGTKLQETQLNKALNEQRSELSSISSIYKSLSSAQLKSITALDSGLGTIKESMLVDDERREILNNTLEGVSKLQAIQQQMAESDPKNVAQQDLIRDSYIEQSSILTRMLGLEATRGNLTEEQQKTLLGIVKAQDDNLAIAEKFGTQTHKSKKFLQDQLDVYDNIEDVLHGIVGTTKVLFSNWKGLAGGALIGAGFAIDKIAHTTKEMGGWIGSAGVSTTVLGLAFEDADGVAKGLAKEMGGLSHVTFQNQLNTNLMAANMGIGAEEAAELTGHFAHLNGGSIETAHNLAESTKSLAKAKGLVPAQVMSDLAGSTKAFAEYGKQGGKNIGEAAVAAGQLGVNMSAMTAVTDSLLDFESSMTAELELGAMLGKTINLSKARQLAYDEDIRGAVKESLHQMGGIDAFNRMDIYQKRQAASAIGLSVDQLQNMSLHLNELNKDGTIQLDTFESINQSITAFATTGLGNSVKTAGALLIAAGQLRTTFSGLSVKGVVDGFKGAWGWAKQLGSTTSMVKTTTDTLSKTLGAGEMVADKAGKLWGAGSPQGKTITTAKESMAGKLKKAGGGGGETALGKGSITDKIGKINMTDVLKGAAAMLVVAGAIWVFGKALQELEKIKDLEKIAIGLGAFAVSIGLIGRFGKMAKPGMKALAAGLKALANPTAILGLAALTIAAIGLGYALKLAAPGITAIADGLVSIMEVITLEKAAAMVVLGIGMGVMAAGLTTLGVASFLAGDSVSDMFEKMTKADLSATSTALMGMGAGLSLIATQLDRIDTAKLDALSEFAISASIGTAVTGIAESVGGVIDTIGNILGTETISDYETKMLDKMDNLIKAVSINRDVYLDREKVTSIVKKTSDKHTSNSGFGLAGA